MVKEGYVDAETLAKPAIAAVRSADIRVVPETWKKTWFNWLENIQPWCVSLQAKCQAPLTGEESQIWRFGPCLLTRNLPPDSVSTVSTPSTNSTSRSPPAASRAD